MVALDNLVVTTSLPVIRADLGSSLADLEWMVNAYTLTFAVLLLTGAALGDRFGRRRLFVIGLAIFTLGSAAAALAPSSQVLILARALQGVGGAIVTPLTLTSVGLLGLVWGVIHGNDRGWSDPQVLVALIGGAALIVGFFLWERRAAHPMLPLSMFRSRGFSAANGVSFLMYFGMFGSVF